MNCNKSQIVAASVEQLLRRQINELSGVLENIVYQSVYICEVTLSCTLKIDILCAY